MRLAEAYAQREIAIFFQSAVSTAILAPSPARRLTRGSWSWSSAFVGYRAMIRRPVAKAGRKAASVLPLPVPAEMRVFAPLAIDCHAAC